MRTDLLLAGGLAVLVVGGMAAIGRAARVAGSSLGKDINGTPIALGDRVEVSASQLVTKGGSVFDMPNVQAYVRITGRQPDGRMAGIVEGVSSAARDADRNLLTGFEVRFPPLAFRKL